MLLTAELGELCVYLRSPDFLQLVDDAQNRKVLGGQAHAGQQLVEKLTVGKGHLESLDPEGLHAFGHHLFDAGYSNGQDASS